MSKEIPSLEELRQAINATTTEEQRAAWSEWAKIAPVVILNPFIGAARLRTARNVLKKDEWTAKEARAVLFAIGWIVYTARINYLSATRVANKLHNAADALDMANKLAGKD